MFNFSKSSHHHKGRIIQKWTFESKSTLLSSAAIADIDGDGKKEVIFGTKDGKIFCLDQESKQKWSYQISKKMSETESFFYDEERIDSVPATPTLHDINNDGKQEILFGTELGILYCLSHDGKLLWQHKAKGAIRGKITVEDINKDGRVEIIFGTTGEQFLILDDKGKERASLKVQGSIEGEAAICKNGDQLHILVGTEKGKLHSFDITGKPLWTFDAKAGIRAAPVFGSLSSEQNVIIGDLSGTLYCLNVNGQEEWRFKTEGAIYSKAVLADVNRDENLEVLFGSCDNRAYCLSNTGERLWSYETDFWVVSSPLVADVDGDGALEVVIGSYDNNLYVLDGEGTYNLDYMPGLSGVAHQAGHYSEVLTQEPGEQIGKRLWQIRTEGIIVGCEALDSGNIIVNVKSGQVDEISHTQ